MYYTNQGTNFSEADEKNLNQNLLNVRKLMP